MEQMYSTFVFVGYTLYVEGARAETMHSCSQGICNDCVDCVRKYGGLWTSVQPVSARTHFGSLQNPHTPWPPSLSGRFARERASETVKSREFPLQIVYTANEREARACR